MRCVAVDSAKCQKHPPCLIHAPGFHEHLLAPTFGALPLRRAPSRSDKRALTVVMMKRIELLGRVTM
jgi:hypothetical protein